MSLSKKLGVASVTAGATAMGLATVANAELQVFDYRDSPLQATVQDDFSTWDNELIVLHMDGTYKRSVNNGGTSYTFYDQDGVTTPITGADQTADSIWVTHHDFTSDGLKGPASGFDGVFAYAGDGGITGHSINGEENGNPLYKADPVALDTSVDGGLAYVTGGTVLYARGGGYAPGWQGNTLNQINLGGDFIGFYLDEPDGRHYGWVEVADASGWWRPYSVGILGWGYETTPGAPAFVAYPPPLPPGDFNDDGDINELDIDLLADAIRNSSIDFALFDISADGENNNPEGVIDINDLDYLVRFLVDTTMGVGTGSEYGDFNLDGLINTTDLTRLATYFGPGTTWAEGNANRNVDLTIDTTDLTILGTYFGFDASADAIPEPATLSLLALGASGLLARRRGK